MGDYIERDKVIRELEWYIERFPDCAECLEARKNIIAHIHSADVRPVVRGTWIKNGWSIRCSICGYDMPFATRNFCPNCGADMREAR